MDTQAAMLKAPEAVAAVVVSAVMAAGQRPISAEVAEGQCTWPHACLINTGALVGAALD